MRIDDVRQCPELAETAIDRIWRAWWKDTSFAVEQIRDPVEAMLRSPDALPCCLIAHVDSEFLGTVSVIASDVEARPELSPWVAALWVEPSHRRSGIATALLEAAVSRAFAQGFDRIFLHSAEQRRPFYEARGWQLFEGGVPEPDMHIFARRR